MIGYAVFCLVIILQFGLLAQATDVLGGHTGRVGVASVMIAGIAGYAYALLTVRFDLSPPLSVLAAICITASISCALGWLILRLGANDFLLGTIAAQLGFNELANNVAALGGPLGIRDIPSIAAISSSDAATQGALWLLLPGAVITGYVLGALLGRRQQVGRILHWIRDNEASAQSVGIAPDRWRIGAFTLQAILSSLAGITIVITQGYVSPQSFNLGMSITVLTVVYLSGTGGNPLLMFAGSGILVLLTEAVRSFGSIPELVGPIQLILINGVLIAILVLRKRGIAGPIIELGPSATRLE